jgi:hypothetical protein
VSELPSCVALPKHSNSVVRGILDKFADYCSHRWWTIKARLYRLNKVGPTSYDQHRRCRHYTHSLKVRRAVMRCCDSYVHRGCRQATSLTLTTDVYIYYKQKSTKQQFLWQNQRAPSLRIVCDSIVSTGQIICTQKHFLFTPCSHPINFLFASYSLPIRFPLPLQSHHNHTPWAGVCCRHALANRVKYPGH